MATQQDQLIQAIRRIAKSDPEIRSVLTALQKRGALDGLVKQVGGSDAAALEDCCTNGDDADPEEKEPGDIDEDAPPEVPEIGDEDGDGESDWSDCETGDPITFAPGGFPQPETCKGDCSRPDPTWEPGYYWESSPVTINPCGFEWGGAIGATPSEAAKTGSWGCDDRNSNGTGNVYDLSFSGIETIGTRISQYVVGTVEMYQDGKLRTVYDYKNSTPTPSKKTCTSDPALSSVCDLTEPPIINDCQDWEPDDTTSYTLSNGCIVASKCDPDASAAAQSCNECITICNEDGQERRVCAIGNGQWILYDPNGKYKGGRYDATGRRLEILPAGETGGYLPSERASGGGGGYDGGTIGGGDGWVWS